AKFDFEVSEKVTGETLIQEGSEIRNTVTPTTDGCDIPKIDDDTDVENVVDHANQSLNEKDLVHDVGKSVETSGTQEELVEDSLPATPV
ncbi:hypothetical protein A2U01_0064617, partial [Trifolium medium]|nr:hypothetical protein [Trifolium medium]